MATDEDYMSFLDKANQDVSGGKQTTAQGSKFQFKTTDAGSEVPKAIREACKDAVYVSDADEPFEEVSLRWNGDGLPDEGMLSFVPTSFSAADGRCLLLSLKPGC
jgi:hypothetical protein